MPTYEYQCANGHTFEAFQKISERPKTKCPECGARASRVISGGAGLIFKGAGFYITDYGKDGKGPRKDTPEGGSAPSAGSATESTSAKPEPKKSSKKAGKDE